MPLPHSATESSPVLVLDGDQPSALAIVRSLGRQGIVVHVGSHRPDALAARSRHAAGRVGYPDPMRDERAFVAWLAECLRDTPYRLVVPVTERTVVPIHRHRDGLPMDRIAVAPAAALEQVLDKARTFTLAEALGIPVPRSITVGSVAEAAAAGREIGYPVVVKPTRSVGAAAGGTRVSLAVRYARDPDELGRHVADALRYGGVVLQEYFRGDGIGVELIADHGEVRYAFQHRRLHEVPLTGGGSSLRISEPVSPALGAASASLVKALGWHGVAMVEFKQEPASGRFTLMEINGRFWGSLPLAVAAGADFPALLYTLMTTGRLDPPAPARVGVVGRSLGRDLDWLEHVLRRAAPAGLVRLPSWGQVLRDLLLVFSPRHRFDVQRLDDPRPGFADIADIGRRLAQRVADALRHRARLAAQRRAARATGGASAAMQAAREVLFVCHGNINRSALAQVYAESRCAGPVRFRSAGFHAAEGRPADPVMVQVAARAGLDLSRSRSRTLTDEQVRSADLILAMELDHVNRLAESFPASRGKTYLLGARAARGIGEVEIPDPYGLPPDRYDAAWREVTRAVDAWLALVPAAEPLPERGGR